MNTGPHHKFIHLTHERPHNYFNVGDKVAVYLMLEDDDERKGKIREGWYSGEVRHGYRHHDGCVSYKLDGVGPQDPPMNDSGALLSTFEGYWGSRMAQPGVMKLEEWLYFRDHSKEYIEWFNESKARLNSDWEFNPINDSDIAYFAKHLLEAI